MSFNEDTFYSDSASGRTQIRKGTAGRKCATPDCRTTLRTTNLDDRCSLCQKKPRLADQKRTQIAESIPSNAVAGPVEIRRNTFVPKEPKRSLGNEGLVSEALAPQALDTDETEEVLPENGVVLSIESIKTAVSAAASKLTKSTISVANLESPKRDRKLARARQVAMYLIRYLRPKISLPRIGKFFGNRDHTTVMHAVKKIPVLRELGDTYTISLLRNTCYRLGIEVPSI